jgi:hypothetical protein
MAQTSPAIADLPEGGVIYEPRSLWSIQTVQLQNGPPATYQFRFEREHFRNGSRYPMTLKRIAVAPINYAFRRTPVDALNQRRWQSTSAVMAAARISIAVPYRQHYARRKIPLGALAALPTGEPLPRPFEVDSGFIHPSGLWGVTALNFDKPMYLPRLGSLEWALSSVNNYTLSVPLTARAYMLYQEEGGLLPGNARTHAFDVAELGTAARYPAAVFPRQTNVGWPFVPDGYASLADAGSTQQFWDSVGQFSTKRFKAQEATRDGSSKLLGMRVMIDQIDTDNAMSPVDSFVAPMSLRIGSRVRTTGAGSQEYFWREGAPLALVCDTITPAAVYELPEPITLAKGDSLDVELEVPAVVGALPADIRQRVMNVGVSFNGFATIEG